MSDNKRAPFAPPPPGPQSIDGIGEGARPVTHEPPQAPKDTRSPSETPRTTNPKKESDVPKGLSTEQKVFTAPRLGKKTSDPPPPPPDSQESESDPETNTEPARSQEPAAPSESPEVPNLHVVREPAHGFTQMERSIGTDKTVAAHMVQKTDPYAVVFKTLLRHTPKDTEDVSNHSLWFARLLFELPRIMRGEQTELIYEAPVDLMGKFLIFLQELRSYVRKDPETHECVRTAIEIVQQRLTEKRIWDMKIELGRKTDEQLREAEEKRVAEEARQKEEEKKRQEREEALRKEEEERIAAALLIERLNEPRGLKKFILDLFGTSTGQMCLLIAICLAVVLAIVFFTPYVKHLL